MDNEHAQMPNGSICKAYFYRLKHASNYIQYPQRNI